VADPERLVGQVDQTSGEFMAQVSGFLDPTVVNGPAEQLAFMTDYWRRLGYRVPDLLEAQQTRLHETLRANPDKRVVPTPVLYAYEDIKDLEQRLDGLLYDPLGSTTVDITTGQETLESPRSWPFIWDRGNFSPDPVAEGSFFDMRYKTPDGELTTIGGYIGAMAREGYIAYDEFGNPWVFPVMDVAAESERSPDQTGKELLMDVHPAVLPESLLTAKLLHVLNDTADYPHGHSPLDVGNKAICEITEGGQIANVVAVASVLYRTEGHRTIYSTFFNSTIHGSDFGIRDAA
jgi:hypothetical protein